MENYATFHVGRIIANFQNEEREFCVEITMYKDGVKTVARANMSARDFALALTGHLSHVTDATVTTYTRGSYQVGGGGGPATRRDRSFGVTLLEALPTARAEVVIAPV
jgi:hypothetical protein